MRTLEEPRIAPRGRLSDRLVARLRARGLDIALANGTPAESNAALALRARRLTRLSRRRGLARAIRRILDHSRRGPFRVGPIWGRVEAANGELVTLADTLAQPTPVSPRGVAQTLLLLTDGSGPLYNGCNRASVAERAAPAAESLGLVA
jgi:hypothetical protein